MLHHLSIAVDHPMHVAKVLAEVCQGQWFPFPPCPGAYIVMTDDGFGTAIELLPAGTELVPGSQDVEFSPNLFASSFTATHAAISVPTELDTIERLAEREGWRMMLCSRGPFRVVELWVENKLLLELLPPVMAAEYTEFMTPANFEMLLKQVSIGAMA